MLVIESSNVMVMVDCLPKEKHRQPQKAFRSSPRSVIVIVVLVFVFLERASLIVFLIACMFFGVVESELSVGGVCDGVRSVW